MNLLDGKAVHSRCVESHCLGTMLLLWCCYVGSPWKLLMRSVQAKRIIEHDRRCLDEVLYRTWLDIPEAVSLRVHRSSHRAHVTELLHVGRQLQHGKLHRSLLLLVHLRIRLKDVLLGSHEPTRRNRRRSTERDILHELRLLDRSASCWWWSLYLARIAMRKGHVLW